MKVTRFALVAAVMAGVMLASPALRAQDTKETPAPKRERPPGGGRDNVKSRLDELVENLKLSDEQKPKVEAILKSHIEKLRELASVPQDQRREKFRALNEERDKKMKEVLTAEQFEKYQKLRPGGARKGPPRPPVDGGEKKAEKTEKQ